MSQNLNLVIYPFNGDKLCEVGYKLVVSAEIPSEWFAKLASEFGLKTTDILMDKDTERTFPIEHFDNKNISEIVAKLEEAYKRFLFREAAKFNESINPTEPTSCNLLALENLDALDHESYTVKISTTGMRSLLSLMDVFYIKQEQYAENDNVFIKVS